ncbi:TadE/TadG family type IV pilus assembly protein [Streptomonospora wellingtoniae]|uniref:Tad domain-containing protein n=1 Tax=Streptomonospora wellingtoniae TaxID=3075544 RepID=A0ABU2KX54_9ACTN|nr:Tad domain-containing protein [Streptomonospora sp. DSM 45055]MDT0303623.1 Tad domain-containing protein [Streptomonospora sp. DSM 45055]
MSAAAAARRTAGPARGPGRRAARSEGGQATAFVVVMTAAFLLCLGLVFDGGGVLRAHTRADLLAQEAARAGVQHIDWEAYRAGSRQVDLDPIAAGAAARAFLTDSGTTGTVSVEGDTVTVTCSIGYDFALLPIGSTTVEATATARPYNRPVA